ncbi:MAG: hypothetical protein KDI71_14990 [Xanthomonadales bacterium]|nr:hypothetical protein [Xanthomonadales bacterium]
MNNIDKEARWQALAEQAERDHTAPGNDSQVDRYRLILRALRQPVGPQLAPDFAQAMQAEVLRQEHRSVVEDALVTVLMTVMVLIGLYVAYPYVAPLLGQMRGSLPLADSLFGIADGALANVPWRAIIGSAAAIGGVMLIDRYADSSPRLQA